MRVSAVIMSNPAERYPQRVEPDTSIDEARLRQQAIGVKLRQMFDEIVNEAVPDDLLDILRKADGKGRDDGQD